MITIFKKMDDEFDIKKIESFLKNLKKETGTKSECISNSSAQNYSRHKPNVSSHCNLEKFNYIQTCLRYNQECDFVVTSLQSSFSFLLEECLKEQKIVRENLDTYKNGRIGDNIKCKQRHDGCSLRKCCSSPYFQDRFGFSSRQNDDVDLRSHKGYMNPWGAIRSMSWTDDQKRKLEKGIMNEYVKQYEKPKAEVSKYTNESANTNYNYCVEKTSLNELVSCNEGEFDWTKLSVVDLDSARSPLECSAMWNMYLHPTINKKRWTEVESKILKKLVEKYGHENWEGIASQLGTNRSAYQCIGHFKIRLSDFSKIKWTEEEIFLLTKFVQMFRVTNFTPWSKIAWLMDGRSTTEIYRMWVIKYGDLKKGTFSVEEDILLVAGLKEFGEDWSRIAQYFPDRNSVQVRGRMVVLKSRQQIPGPWTQFEDNLLLQLVQKYGFGNWTKISTHYLSRNNVQVRCRYKSLMRSKAKHGTPIVTESRISKPAGGPHSLDGLWEAAKKIVQNKKIKLEPNESNSQLSVVYELSQILKPRSKAGRKKGTINFPSYFKQYFKLFHVAYVQRGGRGKDTCREEKIPTLVYHIMLALPLLDAVIFLPAQKELVNKQSILEMDKSVLLFLYERKELIQDNCKFIKFEKPCNSAKEFRSLTPSVACSSKSIYSRTEDSTDRYPIMFSVSASSLIGLRTMLLNRTNIREQMRGLTVQRNIEASSYKSGSHISSCKLWNKRLNILCAWAAHFTKTYPLHEFIINSGINDDVSENEQKSYTARGKKRKRKSKCIDSRSSSTDKNLSVQCMEDENISAKVKQKRAYVKSGKFAMKSKVSGTARRNTRRTKVDC